MDKPIFKESVGRRREMLQLHDRLFYKKLPVLVLGPHGIGKTTLVRLYERRFRDSYTRTSYISARALVGPDAFFSLLARNLSLSTTDPAGIMRALRSEAALLIIDGLSEMHPAASDALMYQIRRLVDTHLEARFLMTSSELQTFRVDKVNSLLYGRLAILNLVGLSREDFARLLGSLGIDVSAETTAEIHARTNGHPLALHLLARLIQRTEQDPGSILAKLDKAYDRQWGSSLTNILIISTKDGLKAIPVTRDQSLGIVTPSSEVFITSPYILIRAHAHFWREKLEEFDALLNDASSKEQHFQEFFEQNPRFLLGLDYRRAIPHPVLYRDEDGPMIPDFFLQPLDSTLCDILDLKLPAEKLIVGARNRLRLSSSVSEVVAQLREYRDYFDDPKLRKAVRDKYGLTAFKPALSVVIGRTPRHISEEKYRQVLTGSSGVNVLTYDDLRRRMERFVSHMSF